MNPSQCSVVVCSRPPPTQPYYIQENQECNNDPWPSFTSLLQSVFAQVHIHSDPVAALEELKHLKRESFHPLLLLDADSTADTTANDKHNGDPRDTVYTPSCSSSDSTASSASATSDSPIRWISGIIRQLDDALIDDIPTIVCSSNQSASFMLDCIHAGAADYLLKPLRLDVIKTLFLKLQRNQLDTQTFNTAHKTRLPSPDIAIKPAPETVPETALDTLFKADTSLNHHLKQLCSIRHGDVCKFCDVANTIYPFVQETHLRHTISSWNFSPFELGRNELIHCVCLVLEQVLVLPQLSHVSFKEGQLYDFVSDLSNTYHERNPYHNFAHAVDVLQCLYYFFCRLGLLSFANGKTNHVPSNVAQKPQDLLQPKDIFALLIAAIGHDAAHPGVNNLFLINSGAPLALLYNDHSVLENFHAMTLFQVIRKHGFDRIAGGPGSPEYQAFRKTIVTSILATDMALHNDYVARIDALASRLRDTNVSRLKPEDCEQERLLICCAMIKCADISNVTRPFRHASKWAQLLIKECISQGDLERAMGLPVVPMNDRNKVNLRDSQLGFIRQVAQGLFQSVSRLLPALSFTADCIHQNLKHWEAHEKTPNDSGMYSINNESSDEAILPAAVETGCKRRNSIDSTNHTAEVLRKRPSRESGHWNGGVCHQSSNEKLPSMPAVAMVNYGPVHPFQLSDDDQDIDKKDSWFQASPRPTANENPIFCQCTIQ